MKSSKNVTICFIGIIIILIALMPFLIYDHGNASKVINNLNTINSKSSFINLRKHTIDNNYKIKKLWTNFYPDSIGLFYSTITEYLGFEINEGEFKVMSLSSFGKPIYEKEFKKIFDINLSLIHI